MARHPRTIAQVEADPRVQSIHQEWNGPSPSWWVYLKPGLVCPHTECGTIHEETIKDVCDLLRTVVTVTLFESMIREAENPKN